MKKKFFNLAVILATLMSSAVFSSCGDDDDDDDDSTPKKEQQTDNNNTDNKKEEDNKDAAKATTSFTAVKGDSYKISNANLNGTLKVEDVAGTTVTLNVDGSTVTVGSANADKSYAIIAKAGGVEAASMSTAKEDPASVLFICKENSVIASGTLANDATIKAGASETTFTKQN